MVQEHLRDREEKKDTQYTKLWLVKDILWSCLTGGDPSWRSRLIGPQLAAGMPEPRRGWEIPDAASAPWVSSSPWCTEDQTLHASSPEPLTTSYCRERKWSAASFHRIAISDFTSLCQNCLTNATTWIQWVAPNQGRQTHSVSPCRSHSRHLQRLRCSHYLAGRPGWSAWSCPGLERQTMENINKKITYVHTYITYVRAGSVNAWIRIS